MDILSIKDFISLLSPCFACSGKNKITFNSKLRKEISIDLVQGHLIAELNRFYGGVSYLKVNLNSSQIDCNDLSFFEHQPIVTIYCIKCGGYSISSPITLKKVKNINYISPIEISLQSFSIKYEDKVYLLLSQRRNNSTTIICNNSQEMDASSIDLPFTSTVKFKSKQKMIEKFNKLLIFT